MSKQNNKKSSAKAAGIKSAFILPENEILVTSFGRGNDVILEKRITPQGEITPIASQSAFELTSAPQKNLLAVTGKRAKGVVDNPQSRPEHTVKENVVHTKAALEQQYFGQTFEDNIHIQLISCILDIKKILAIHTNNVVYALNNIQRNLSENKDTIGLGIFNLQVSYEQFKANPKKYPVLQEFMQCDTLSYFETVFYRKPTKGI